MTSIIDALNWRYATKKYDTTKKLTKEQLSTIMEATRLSPSSFGLQPFTILHITSNDLREKLKPVGYGQAQITDASDFFVFAVPTNLSNEHVTEFMERTAKDRGVPVDTLKDYANMLSGGIASRTPEQNTGWAARQAYISLGVLLTAAALAGVDATPMEGFDPAAFDQILGLKDQNLTSVVMVALGFRATDDAAATLAKVRKPTQQLFIER